MQTVKCSSFNLVLYPFRHLLKWRKPTRIHLCIVTNKNLQRNHCISICISRCRCVQGVKKDSFWPAEIAVISLRLTGYLLTRACITWCFFFFTVNGQNAWKGHVSNLKTICNFKSPYILRSVHLPKCYIVNWVFVMTNRMWLLTETYVLPWAPTKFPSRHMWLKIDISWKGEDPT